MKELGSTQTKKHLCTLCTPRTASAMAKCILFQKSAFKCILKLINALCHIFQFELITKLSA